MKIKYVFAVVCVVIGVGTRYAAAQPPVVGLEFDEERFTEAVELDFSPTLKELYPASIAFDLGRLELEYKKAREVTNLMCADHHLLLPAARMGLINALENEKHALLRCSDLLGLKIQQRLNLLCETVLTGIQETSNAYAEIKRKAESDIHNADDLMQQVEVDADSVQVLPNTDPLLAGKVRDLLRKISTSSGIEKGLLLDRLIVLINGYKASAEELYKLSQTSSQRGMRLLKKQQVDALYEIAALRNAWQHIENVRQHVAAIEEYQHALINEKK